MFIQWDQWAATTVPMLVALGGATMKLWLQRQKEHRENSELLKAMVAERLYLLPHDHIESRIPGDENRPLTRGGIIRMPIDLGGQLKRGGTG